MKFALLGIALGALAWPADIDSHIRETIMVPMRDGVLLATDIYRPAHSGKPLAGRFPVLVTRTPYDKGGERGKGEFFARNGYVFVAQDCRGFIQSQGRFEPLVHEGEDGFDTIEWAAAQAWSNGRVGSTGASYLAMVQFAALLQRPPHLVAVYAAVGGTNYFADAARKGGVPSFGWPVWIAAAAASRANEPALRKQIEDTVRNPADWLRQGREHRASLFEGFPDHEVTYRKYYEHPSFDGYWRQPGFWPAGYIERMKDVPMLLLTGWFDSFTEPTIRLYTTLARRQRAPKHLVVGPWPHAYGKRECGNAVFPESAALDERSLRLQWFGRWLKGEEAASRPPVRYFVMGGGEIAGAPGGSWKEASAWPPPGSESKSFYLTDDGRLTTTAPATTSSVSYVFDPSDPTPAIGGRYRNACIVNLDASALAGRFDLARFVSEPLSSPLEIIGPIRLQTNVSTSARDADFMARLVDVWPDGYAAPVAEGQIRLSRRIGEGHEEIRPGRVYAVHMDLGDTAILIPAGHRLRIDVTSAAFPALEPNPGTGAEPWVPSRGVTGKLTIITGGLAPSRITVSVPAGASPKNAAK